MGPEFEKGDGRLRPSLQQRLPGAEGPPEGCSTAPRHAACAAVLFPAPLTWRVIFSLGAHLLRDLTRVLHLDHCALYTARTLRRRIGLSGHSGAGDCKQRASTRR